MVKKMIFVTKMLFLAAGYFILFSCNLGMYDVLGRTTRDPFPEIPNVRSFNGDRSIIISWTWDEAADEYYLWRAVNANYPLQYILVYNGPHTEYKDNFDLPDVKQLYLYRLEKRRGTKHFRDLDTPGKAGLGVVSNMDRDIYEPNDSPGQATPLTTVTLAANSWYYSSNATDGICIYDEDWYYVNIPAHCRAGILLYDFNAIGGQNVDHFEMYILPDGRNVRLISDTEEFVENHENFEVRKYICIRPLYSTFQTEENLENDDDHPQPPGTCGAFISYTIRVHSVKPIN